MAGCAVTEAKLKGEGLESEPEGNRSNVIDLMAALKKSLGHDAEEKPAERAPVVTTKKRVVTARKTEKKPATAAPAGPAKKPVRKQA